MELKQNDVRVKEMGRWYQPEYSIMELAADDISLEPSSNMRRLFIKPGGSDPGPDGDGR